MTLALYVPRASPVHRTPAGVKLLVLAGLAVLLFAAPTLPVAAGTLAGVLLLGLAFGRLPVGLLARQARAVVIWVVAIVVVQAVLGDVLAGVAAGLRLLALVLAAAVVTATTRVTAMVAVVGWVCAPLRLVGVRPARIGLVVAMALRFIPLIAERADRIRAAQAARGGRARGLRGLTVLVVPLLVQVLQLAHTVSEALDARGADEPAPRGPRRARRCETRPGRKPVRAGRRGSARPGETWRNLVIRYRTARRGPGAGRDSTPGLAGQVGGALCTQRIGR